MTQLFLAGKARLRESEVLDLDEDAYRDGKVSVRLYLTYIVAPGPTTPSIARALNLEKTLVGVDVACNGKLIVQDTHHAQLLDLVNNMNSVCLKMPCYSTVFEK